MTLRKTLVSLSAALGLVLGSTSVAQAAVALLFEDTFEDRVADQALIGNNWTWFDITYAGDACEGDIAGTFGPFSDGDGSDYAAENRNYFTASQEYAGAGDSYFRAGLEVPAWGGALTNMMRVYGNSFNAATSCQQVRIFQEWTITESGDFTFSFDVAKDQYGAPANGEEVGAFIQVLRSSDNSFAFLSGTSITSDPPAEDATTASRSIAFEIPAEFVGELLQFGFYNNVTPNLGQSWATSGAYYDNIGLEVATPPPPPPPPPEEPGSVTSIPTLDMLGKLALLLALGVMGMVVLNRRGL